MKSKRYTSILDLEKEYGGESIAALIDLQEALKNFQKFENSQNHAAQFCDNARQMLERVRAWPNVPLVPARNFFNVYDEVVKQELGLLYMRPAPVGCGFLGTFTDCFGITSYRDSQKEDELIVVRILDIQLFGRRIFSMVPYSTLVERKERITYLPRFSRKRIGGET